MLKSNKRLFIGVNLNPQSLPAILAARRILSITAARKHLEIKWIPKNNWHITLKFLGNTPIHKIPDIETALKGIAQDHHKMTLKLEGMGIFSRVIWIGVQHENEFKHLQLHINKAVSAVLPLESDPIKYTPHLTIGRIRKIKNCKELISPFVREKFGKMELTNFTLYESVMQSHSPEYIPLCSFSLNEHRVDSPDY